MQIPIFYTIKMVLQTLSGTSYSGMEAQLTTGFDLPDVVTGEPARLAVERSLPPTSLLLPRHEDRVAFIERQFVLIVLLEVVAGLHHLLPASTVLRHLLWEGLQRDGQQQHKHK